MATLRGVLAGVFAAAFATFTLAGAVSAADEAVFVRERGDLKRLVIHGAETFSEAEIKEALAVDIDVAVAARPDAPLETLHKTLSEKTLAGYLCNGFADAKIQVVFDPAADKLVMTIEEGLRYLAGQVVVEGLDASLADRIREALTVEKPPANGALSAPQAEQIAKPKPKKKVLWSVGEPARLDGESQRRLREKIEAMLYDSGCLFSEFTLELTPDRNARSVALKIKCIDRGSEARIDELQLSGNEKLSREEILEFLDIRPGSIWSGEVRRRCQQRLTQSGRFTKSKVGTVKPSKPGGKLRAYIDVTEYVKAPPLSQPLSREEQALVQLSQWLADFHNGDDDVVFAFKVDEYQVEAVVAPKFGALVLIRKRPANAEASQPGLFRWAFVTSDERIGFYSAPRGRKLVAIPTPAPLVANASLSLHEGPAKLTGQGEFMFGLEISPPSRRSRRRHCEFRFKDTPVGLLSLAHKYDSKLSWEGDVLTVEFKGRSLKFNGKTGQLIEVVVSDEEGAMRMTVAPGQFERKLAELDAATRDLPNEAAENVERPLSSVLEFIADEALAFEGSQELEESRPQLRVLRKLISLGLLKPLDRLGIEACRQEVVGESFSIPWKHFYYSLSDFKYEGDWLHKSKFQEMLRNVAEYLGLRLEQCLPDSGSWPQAVYRQAIYAQAQKGVPADRAVDVTKLCASPAAGPLCCLSAAAAATEWQLGAPAALFANLGKTKLTLAEFQNDYRPLLDANSLVGETLLCLADVLRGLEADEVNTLVAMLKSSECLDERSLDALVAVAAVLRQHREEPVDQALAASLDQLWQLGLRNQIAMLLDRLAADPAPTRLPPTDKPEVAGNGVNQPAPGERHGARDGAANPTTPREPAQSNVDTAQGYKPTTYGGDAYTQAEDRGYLELPPTGVNYAAGLEAAPGDPPLALDGYSAVTLVELRRWRTGDRRYRAVHGGRLYLFASEFERKAFLKEPGRYRVGNDGLDIVEQVDHRRQTPGRREFGLFSGGRILLFASAESRAQFENDRLRYEGASDYRAFQPDGRYGNHPPAAEPARPESGEPERPAVAEPAKASPLAKPTRAARRRTLGRRFR